MRTEFRILGPLAAEIDGVVVTPTSAKERTLLAILVMRCGQVVAAERLIEEVWPDLPPERGRRVLQVRIGVLRKLLKGAGAGDLLQSAAAGYVLAADPADVDVARFDALVAQGRDQMAAGNAEAAALVALRLSRALAR